MSSDQLRSLYMSSRGKSTVFHHSAGPLLVRSSTNHSSSSPWHSGIEAISRFLSRSWPLYLTFSANIQEVRSLRMASPEVQSPLLSSHHRVPQSCLLHLFLSPPLPSPLLLPSLPTPPEHRLFPASACSTPSSDPARRTWWNGGGGTGCRMDLGVGYSKKGYWDRPLYIHKSRPTHHPLIKGFHTYVPVPFSSSSQGLGLYSH
eukprot:757394-Hanusia_phi.AAC.11